MKKKRGKDVKICPSRKTAPKTGWENRFLHQFLQWFFLSMAPLSPLNLRDHCVVWCAAIVAVATLSNGQKKGKLGGNCKSQARRSNRGNKATYSSVVQHLCLRLRCRSLSLLFMAGRGGRRTERGQSFDGHTPSLSSPHLRRTTLFVYTPEYGGWYILLLLWRKTIFCPSIFPHVAKDISLYHLWSKYGKGKGMECTSIFSHR